MDRRSFFRSMIGGVAASAAVRTWPFRVFSFPANILAVRPRFPFIGDVHRPMLLVDSEAFTINSWNPKDGRLIVTRGTNGLFEIPLPSCPPYKIIDSYVRPSGMEGILDTCFGFEFDEEVNVETLTIPIHASL